MLLTVRRLVLTYVKQIRNHPPILCAMVRANIVKVDHFVAAGTNLIHRFRCGWFFSDVCASYCLQKIRCWQFLWFILVLICETISLFTSSLLIA